MAKLSQRRARRLANLAIAFGVLVSTSGRADLDGPEGIDLIGTWHVLIHYSDDHSHDASLLRWDDKIWVFELAGSRLRWTEYPIVVFEDSSGRFESLGGSRTARVVHGWEPNAAQRAQIRGGLEVNPRGSKTKTLRKQDDGAWRTATRPVTSAAMVVSYIENWSIENPTTLPVFRREDTLGSAATENYDGVTQFTTEEVGSGGRILRGTFERDGSRHGTFRLMRSGAARDVKGKGKSEGQRFYEMFLGEGFHSGLLSSPETIEALGESTKGDPTSTDGEARTRVRSAVRAALEKNLRAHDLDPRDFEREVSSLTRQITAQLLDEGRSPEEIQKMLAEGEINP
jgi:hypothetical protein